MLECLVGLIVLAIVILIVILVVEKLLAAFEIGLTPPIIMLIRLLGALIVLIYALQCLGIVGGGHPFHLGLREP